MKKSTNLIITAALLLCSVLCLSACSDQWEAPYASLQDSGYHVSVRFDVNGGLFAGTKDVTVVDVYSLENGLNNPDGTVGFYLLTPEDAARAEGAFPAAKNSYFLAGWYTQRSPRVDKAGQPLDEYGVPTAVSGREQGYTYSGKWDFDRDLLCVDPNGSYSADTPVLTLYAAWVPYINYEFYAVDAQTGEFTYLDTTQAVDLEIPEWNEKTGKLDLKKFPKRDGMTFDAAYRSADLSNPLTETILGQEDYVDFETGTLSVETVPVYTTWLEGTWFKIYSAQQFYNNARLDGNYIICNDIDFTDAVWSPTLVKGNFTGKILGNGYKFSNISVIQADNSQIHGGLFGALDSGAELRDLTLENVSFTVEAGSRMQGTTFGLLTGTRSSGAVLENVTVTGTLYISENCYPQSDYTIGLLCGSGSTEGVSYTISCQTAEDNSDVITLTVHDDDSVTVTFENP